MLKIEKGKPHLLDELDAMYQKCKENLLQKQIYQWDDSYPTRESIAYHLENNELYCLFKDTALVGAVILNEWQSPEYTLIDWTKTEGRFLIVHSFVIHPIAQGKGYSKILLSFWEDYTKKNKYTGIRLDAFTGNPVSLRLYETNDYKCRGAVYFASKPVPYNWYNCYEKIVE
ncbi:GNAT family N-acetyltransferase [Bacillus sp. DX1.1]|uniref:GNAT family N-acetyltransferase n=1 Tax=unclassified Bacillus (in: firmicutes) TaxID=185979 RepID=UPI00256FF794|nr:MULTISPECIES: GNAT family N-acetyltransferase [unclassified Bacillus (in: firmicutes)]MDM5157090.1 GNAT family N-acetyltransferase [Bacillus sp. DX1.1]WJE81326.1 GNAT family N-acetyltransferase [Bacillus sp. DX3.1]